MYSSSQPGDSTIKIPVTNYQVTEGYTLFYLQPGEVLQDNLILNVSTTKPNGMSVVIDLYVGSWELGSVVKPAALEETYTIWEIAQSEANNNTFILWTETYEPTNYTITYSFGK